MNAQQRRGADAGSPDGEAGKGAGAWTDGRAPADPLDTYAEELAAAVQCWREDHAAHHRDPQGWPVDRITARHHLRVLLAATHDVARALHDLGHP